MKHDISFPPIELQPDSDIEIRQSYQQRQTEIFVLEFERDDGDDLFRKQYIDLIARRAVDYTHDFLSAIQPDGSMPDYIKNDLVVPNSTAHVFHFVAMIATLTVLEEADARLFNYRLFATRFIENETELAVVDSAFGDSASYDVDALAQSIENHLVLRNPLGMPIEELLSEIYKHVRNAVTAQDLTEIRWLQYLRQTPAVKRGLQERQVTGRKLMGLLLGKYE
jgi:hypothetical protein